MLPVLLLISLIAPSQAQSKPAPPPTLTGKWAVTLEMQSGTANPTLELKQEGEKITGTYTSGRYGKFPLTGTLKGRALRFSCTMNAEGTEVVLAFAGEVAEDFQTIKGDADLGGAGEATWYAKPDKGTGLFSTDFHR